MASRVRPRASSFICSAQILGVPALATVRRWLLALYNKDVKSALEIIKQVEIAGTDVIFFLENKVP